MPPQDSTTICKKNSKGANVSIPIELEKNNMEDHYFIKLGDFYIDMNHVKEVKNSIQQSKFFMGINLLKKLLLLSQIISHSKILGELKHLKFDQCYRKNYKDL
jgi:hypothetical protein